ncbi:MAG: hypothetical protein CMC82_01770 [Flavobacteriaceae bacterium]|nr:hypothetical protein [Flavobacteriaceae bacterium]|tara:strand:- start:703 stop:936 length:234 start_codon:yes stop_codon:yes gene_type:complete
MSKPTHGDGDLPNPSPFKHGEPYWTIKGEGTDAELVEHIYSDDIGLDGMAEQDGYEERYYVKHRLAWLALQRIHNTP